MLTNQKMSRAKSLLSTAASVAATAMLVRTIANEFLPPEILNYLSFSFQDLSRYFSSQLTIVIEEFQGLSLNQVYKAAEVYLGTNAAPSTQRLKVAKSEEENKLALSIDRGEVVIDVYENVEMKWKLVCTKVDAIHSHSNRNRRSDDLSVPMRSEVRQYELSFHKQHKEMVLNSYLPYILQKAKMIIEDHKTINLHAVIYGRWDTNDNKLNHPMTFKTLAMDSELKKAVLEDLENFRNGEEYYKRVGKAWKRGYLLYGPPGTGKSSLTAAMANHLNYDVYDLDLTDLVTNSDLRFLLLSMPSQSIMVVEDIDCSIKLQNRESEDECQSFNRANKKVTLSGLLNFIDGLWSCCGEERIIVFTTNHKERLDPALLRPGRMDVHIHLSYCNASIFKQLAFNYLGVSDHPLFRQIEKLLLEVNATPAEVAGELMKTSNQEAAFQGLLKFLHQKINDKDMEPKN